MPSKRPGKHHCHVTLPEKDHKILAQWCNSGVQRLTVTGILEDLLSHFVTNYVKPRMDQGEGASWEALDQDLPQSVKEATQKIDPRAFKQ